MNPFRSMLSFAFFFILLACNSESEIYSVDIREIQVLEAYQPFLSQVNSHRDSNSISFVFATDLHNQVYSEHYSYSNNIIGKIKRLVSSVNELNQWLDLSCVIIGGDYLRNTDKTTKDAAKEALQDFSGAICGIKDLPVLCLKGNHDDNSIAGRGNTLTQNDLYELNGAYFEDSHIVRDKRNPKGYYGYFDYVPDKIRIIYLNSIDMPWIESGEELKYKGIYHKGIQQCQLDFLKEALCFSEPGWGVIIVSHHSVTSIEGYNTSSDTYITPQHGGSQLYGIIKAFKEKGVFHGKMEGDFASTVDVDYTNNASNTVICLLNGHIHCDRNAFYDDMLFCSTTSATLGNLTTNTDASIYIPTNDTSGDISYDIVTVNKAKGIVYFDRYGFGVSRKFSYSSFH